MNERREGGQSINVSNSGQPRASKVYGLLLAFLVLFTSTPARADEQEWLRTVFVWDLDKESSIYLAPGIRQERNDIMEVRLGGTRALTPWLTVGGEGLKRWRERGDEWRATVFTDVNWRMLEGRWTVRQALDLRWLTGDPRQRYRVTLASRYGRFRIADEVAIDLHGSGVIRNRASLGYTMPMDRRSNLGVMYIWERSESGNRWRTEHIFAAEVTIKM